MACCCCCIELWLGLLTFLLGGYLWVQHRYSYWTKRHVKQSTPSFPLGSCQGISRTRNIGDVMKLKYMEGRGERFVGIYVILGPGLLIRDPDLIKTVLTKDFNSFSGRGFNVDPNFDKLSAHLFFLDGRRWRNMRTKLTPAFTSGKMKMMFPIIDSSSQEMTKFIADSPSDIFEVGDLLTRYTTNVVTRCAFGVDVDFFKNPDPELMRMIDRVSNPTKADAIRRGLAVGLGLFTKTLPIRLVPTVLNNFFTKLVTDIVEEREAKNIAREDFMQLLIELKQKGILDDPDARKKESSEETDFTMNDVVAQAFVFLLGGFDTSRTTMQVTLYELAKHQAVQDKVREEIITALGKSYGKVTYESLSSLTYLEQVINESTRLHPIIPILNRECSRPFQLPGTDLVLNPGDKVWISTAGMASDPELFPNPEAFDPDRFSPERKSEIRPYSFMPFGEGPRTCIGNRFANMQMKTGLTHLLSKYKVKMCESTPAELKTDPKKGLLAILGGIPLKISPV